MNELLRSRDRRDVYLIRGLSILTSGGCSRCVTDFIGWILTNGLLGGLILKGIGDGTRAISSASIGIIVSYPSVSVIYIFCIFVPLGNRVC